MGTPIIQPANLYQQAGIPHQAHRLSDGYTPPSGHDIAPPAVAAVAAAALVAGSPVGVR